MLGVRSRNLDQSHMTNNQFCRTQTPQGRHGREVLDLEIQGHHHFSKFHSRTNFDISNTTVNTLQEIVGFVCCVRIGLGHTSILLS